MSFIFDFWIIFVEVVKNIAELTILPNQLIGENSHSALKKLTINALYQL